MVRLRVTRKTCNEKTYEFLEHVSWIMYFTGVGGYI